MRWLAKEAGGACGPDAPNHGKDRRGIMIGRFLQSCDLAICIQKGVLLDRRISNHQDLIQQFARD